MFVFIVMTVIVPSKKQLYHPVLSLEMDECTMNGKECGANAECISKEGMYKCICKNGFHGDDHTIQYNTILARQYRIIMNC